MDIITSAKGLVAVGTFSHAVVSAIFHTFFAKDVPASLDNGVFEIHPADGADRQRLAIQVSFLEHPHTINIDQAYPQHLVLIILVPKPFRFPSFQAFLCLGQSNLKRLDFKFGLSVCT